MAKVNELFNPKTIKRLCSSVKISTAQKKASAEWLKLLESGQLEKEKQNYFKFALIILKDLLGYQVKEEMGYEEGNVEFTFADQKGKKIICFEAKGTKTKDLFAPQFREKKEHSTPIKQTWDYMGTLNLDYGVATNYGQFVLIDKSKGTSKYHIFNFKDVKNNEDKLKEFIAIFSKESIIDKKFVVTLYDQSVIEEKEFTKQFYKLFHETRLMLIKEFQNNGDISKEDAIHYAQLFLNRMIFIFFAEDTGKIPQRLVRDQMLKVLDAVPVSEHSRYACDTIYSIFESLDKGASTPVQIFGFNGGLFQDKIPPRFFFKDLTESNFFKKEYQHSELKKKVKLDEFADKIIKKYKNRINPIVTNLLYMSSFDFNTELNVNILGHIFEQSLTDLEDLQENKTSKRKKEGIFYTPEYVTDFICRNAIIRFLSKKNVITSEELIKEHSDNIDELEEKFKKIKILDPACGSGAFLLKAVDILLEIHKEIQTSKELKGQYSISMRGKKHKQIVEQFTLTKWNEESEARKIIENNIFGVDINEESAEITKLSLFLKIATGNRKLIDLSQNIRVGNSLISDKKIAKEKAFSWEKEFKEILDGGGFDIIIGNPPYVRVQELNYEDIDYFKSKYSVAHKRIDISMLFFQLATNLIKTEGKIGFISSSQFMTAEYGRNLRKLLSNMRIEKFVDFGSLPVFEDAIAYPTIMIYSKNKPSSFNYNKITKLESNLINNLTLNLDKEHEFLTKTRVDQKTIGEEIWNFGISGESDILDTIRNVVNHVTLGSFANPSTGLTTGADKFLLLGENKVLEEKLEQKSLIKVLRGRNIDPWNIKGPFDYAIYPYHFKDGKTELLEEKALKQKFPHIHSYLLENKKELLGRKDSRKTVAENKKWFGLIRKGKLDVFNSKKIVTSALTKHNSFALDENGSAFLTGGAGVFAFVQNSFDNNYLIAIMNSKLIEYFLHSISTKKQGGYYSYLNTFLSQIPIIQLDKKNQEPYIQRAVKIATNTKEIENKITKFQNRILERFSDITISKKIGKFYVLDFSTLLSEISKKSSTKLSLSETDEWEDYFNSYKKTILDLLKENQKLLNEIDLMVFDLYQINEKQRQKIVNSLTD